MTYILWNGVEVVKLGVKVVVSLPVSYRSS